MTVASIFEKQVEALVQGMSKLEQGRGMDVALMSRLRRTVCAEVVNMGELRVVTAAMGALNGTKAGDRLRDMVMECNKHFYLDDRVLSLVVVPVAVRLKSRMDGDVVISEARADDLDTLAMMMMAKLGSKGMFFDKRIYAASDLVHAKASTFLELGKKLEAGEVKPATELKSTSISSKAEADWQMVYLIGFEVNELNDEQIGDSEEAQEALVKWRCFAEQAVAEVDEVLFNEKVNADVKCHGMLYGDKGIKLGEDLLRSYRLESLIKNFEQGVSGVRFWYTKDDVKGCIRLMIQSHLMTIEHRWKLFPGEGVTGFKTALDKAIDEAVPFGDVVVNREVTMAEYEKKAETEGLVWK